MSTIASVFHQSALPSVRDSFSSINFCFLLFLFFFLQSHGIGINLLPFQLHSGAALSPSVAGGGGGGGGYRCGEAASLNRGRLIKPSGKVPLSQEENPRHNVYVHAITYVRLGLVRVHPVSLALA